MVYSRFQIDVTVRLLMLLANLVAIDWIFQKGWYVDVALAALMMLVQVWLLASFVTSISRDMTRFLESIIFDDGMPTFMGAGKDDAFIELNKAMVRMQDHLRNERFKTEAKAQYMKGLIAHVPVNLIAIDNQGKVELLNLASKRLFGASHMNIEGFFQYGETFGNGMRALRPGQPRILRMESASGSMQLKIAATDIKLNGSSRRIVSLQSIESELVEQELTAWQTVIRMMAHEVSNSLTPISSLAGTGRQLLQEAKDTSDSSRQKLILADVQRALETIARRCEGLQNFVLNHRRVTKRLVAVRIGISVREILLRLQQLLEGELRERNIDLVVSVEPETLTISADADLLDQALINLVRNAIEALHGSNGHIALNATKAVDGQVLISVSDNGPGIPDVHKSKVFIPFFTTKRQGSGVGLTLVRQIMAAHGGAVTIGDAPGGGAAITLAF